MNNESKKNSASEYSDVCDGRISPNIRFKLGRNKNGWCVRRYDGNELLEIKYFDSYEEMMGFAEKLLFDLENRRLLEKLSSSESQGQIKYFVDDIVSELAERVRVAEFENDEGIDDCYEYDFDEDVVEYKFYQLLAEEIKTNLLSGKDRKFISNENINDYELCTEYADAWYQEQDVIQTAINRFSERSKENDNA